MSIADNLRRVQERIVSAAHAAGRNPNEITLVGVTKYVGAREAAELVAAGCHDLGESRPQELWNKVDALHKLNTVNKNQRAVGLTPAVLPAVPPAVSPDVPPPEIRWHLIGHLQRNKIRRTLPLVTLIHSIDSERLLAAINNALPLASGEGRGERALDTPPTQRTNILLEVNTSGEPAKHGLAPNDVEPLLAAAPQYPHVAIRGLMTMAASEGGQVTAARNFASLRDLRDRLKSNSPPGASLDELSMGMSGDFEVAIREGATIVRVGSLLWE